jgi:serine/threonine-protein kinase
MIGAKLGNYTVLGIFGNGSLGTVYRAEDPDGNPVALKLVRSDVLCCMELRERFLQSALVASEIHHDSICPILEIGDDNEDLFVVMPIIHGVTLAEYLEADSLPWPYALDISLKIGAGLKKIHENKAAHRALKPANIWLLEEEHPHVLISDCGIGRFTELPLKTRGRFSPLKADIAAAIIPPASLAYMSPEQVRGDTVDFRSDIFSFGVLVYEMLSGRHPFEARNSIARISAILEAQPPSLVSKFGIIPLHLESILLRAMAKNKNERYQSIQELLNEMRSVRKTELPPRVRLEIDRGIRKWFFSKIRQYISK